MVLYYTHKEWTLCAFARLCWFTEYIYIYRDKTFHCFCHVENRKFRPVFVLSHRNVFHHLLFVSVPNPTHFFFPTTPLPTELPLLLKIQQGTCLYQISPFCVKCCQQNRPFLTVFRNVYVFTLMMCCLLSVLVWLCIMVCWMHTLTVHTHTHIYIYIYIYIHHHIHWQYNVSVIKIIILTWWCVMWSGLLLQDEVWMNERMNIYLWHTKTSTQNLVFTLCKVFQMQALTVHTEAERSQWLEQKKPRMYL